jgi:hypothetical protein
MRSPVRAREHLPDDAPMQVDLEPAVPEAPAPETPAPETPATEVPAATEERPPLDRRPPAGVEPGAARTTDVPRVAVATRTGPSSEPAHETSAPSSEPASDGTWSLWGPAPSASSSAPLAGDKLATAVSAGVRAVVAEGARRQVDPVTRALRSVPDRDIELGLAPGSSLIALTRDEVRRSRAPNVGHALFEFRFDSAGAIASVSVLDVSSGRPEWEEVASAIAREARAKPPIHLPAGSKGAAITFEITSAIKTVDGATPKNDPIAKVAGAITDPIGTILTGIAGQPPLQRIVAARVVAVEAL